VKRDPRLVELSRDHYRALVLAAALRQSGRSAEQADRARADLLARFPVDIEPHFRIEEETLLAGLGALGGDALPLLERALQDHAALRGFTARVARGEAVDLPALGQRLHDHVRFEERELFQFCQARLPGDVLRRVWQRTQDRVSEKPPK
jgi:hypothetical protein